MAQSQKLTDYSFPQIQAQIDMFWEKRVEYDGSNNPIYVAYNRESNAATDDATWFVVKLTYSGTNMTRYQLPDDGVKFLYTWDDRATYFS